MISPNVSAIFPRRSVFSRNREKKFDCDMGRLIPIEVQTMYPGDKVKLNFQALVRTVPLVVPPMCEINCYAQAYFVAYRALDENFDDFISGGPDGDNSYELPNMNPVSGSISKPGDNCPILHSAWDYLGFPMHPFKSSFNNTNTFSSSNPKRVHVLSYPFMAIDNIWNEYYRNENLEDEIQLGSSAYKLCNRVHWNRDYFTQSLPFEQRGISPALPLYGTAPVYGTLNTLFAYNDSTNSVYGLSNWHSKNMTGSAKSIYTDADMGDIPTATISDTGFQIPYSSSDFPNFKNILNANLSKVTAGSISDLRLAFQIQLWMERNARCGVRYSEFIQAHFGIHPTDERLQRPEYIGGCKFPVLTSEVVQTSSTSTTPQGNLAGKGIGLNSGYLGTYTAKEYGCLVVMFYIKPKSEYSAQGVERQWQVNSRFDFYSPEFAHLSMQGITNSELFVSDNDDTNSAIFGYSGRYDDLRYNQSQVCGNLRPDIGNLSYWTLARSFSSPPTLSSSFITCNPDKRIFAIQDDTPSFIVDCVVGESWLRPMPKVAEPGYIDHPYY